MRVLHVIHSLDPRSGGPSHAIRQMCRAQVDAGFDVTLLATNVQSSEPWAENDEYLAQLQRDENFRDLELVVQSAFGRHGPWRRFSYSPDSRRWLARQLADSDRRPDVIHIHGVFSHVTSTGARIARANDIPYIIRPTGALDPGCYDSGNRWLKFAFSRLLLQRDLRGAAFVQATSDAEALSLARWISMDRIRVVPLGVEVCRHNRNLASDAFWQKFPKLRGRRIVLFIARVAPIKRAELLVEAVGRLRASMPDLALLIVGQDAGGMAAVQSTIARHGLANEVEFCGFLQGADKEAAFAAADVFALPSLHENFGISVVEAMAHELPVVVTPTVASHVFVDACGCGRTVDGTADELARGLREVLSCSRLDLGKKGRDFVAENLTWSSIVRQLGSLYRECRERRGHRTVTHATASQKADRETLVNQ